MCIWLDSKTQWYAQLRGKKGRNRIYSDTAIQCYLMIKSLFRLFLRMVTGFVQSLIKLCRLDWTAPDYSTICRRQKHIDIAITADNGKEFSLHEYVAEELEIDWYFIDPYSAWQRGTNENTNGLIRQYIRKGSDLNLYTDEYILEITQRINHRPRKRLGFKSPSQVLCQQQGVALQMPI